MRAWSVLGNSQRLDGGAMFGNAPKALWTRWIEPDERNRIPLACRAMLLEASDGRRILCETGIGAFFEPKLRDRYGVVEAEHVLLDNLTALGVTEADIDAVILSHLHFDHAGGLLSAFEEGVEPRLLFPQAKYYVGQGAWARALDPHPRDRASFIPALHRLLIESGRLVVVEGDREASLPAEIRFRYSEGHTPGQMHVEVQGQRGPVLFAGDLVPGRPWMHLPITMGYDRYPERLIEEKRVVLEDLLERGGTLFFTHDAAVSAATVGRDAKGRFAPAEQWESWVGELI